MFVTLIKPLARLHPRAWDFVQLVRLDRPIGIYLLLWPTLWSLWIAADGVPELKNLLIFVLGVILMRAAGCVINDFADRNFDGHVARTKARPLATGKISVREAWITFAVLVALSFGLVLLTNATTVWLSFGAVAVASLYPFMKRYTYYPQVVLGAAYSWGILMAFTAERGELPASAWLLFLANVLWTVAYDSYYAMTDREDDLKIGIKSTAILFGDADRLIIGSLQGLTLLLLALAGNRFELGLCFYLGLAVAAACFVWEAWSTRDRDPQACFRAFLHNHWAGLAIFLGTVHVRLGDVPGAHLAVTVLVARLLVLDEGIKGLAVVGPLLGAVLASDQAPVAAGLRSLGRCQRRPVLRALPGTGGLPFAVLVVGIERHALAIDQHAVLLGGRRHRFLGQRGERRQGQRQTQRHVDSVHRVSLLCLQVERSPPAGTAPEPVEHSPAAGSRRKLRRCVTYLTQFRYLMRRKTDRPEARPWLARQSSSLMTKHRFAR